MADLNSAVVAQYLGQAANPANSTHARGRAYEDALAYIFESVPGCQVQRNSLNRFHSEEIDIAVMNFKPENGLRALPEIFLIECKNWREPVDSATVSTFATKLRHRSCKLGILIAANGVTGNPYEKTAAYQAASNALQEKIRILLLTTDDLCSVRSHQDVVNLIHRRLLDLIAAGTFTLA
ncbi:restriction endonuclease [Nocardia beijingensis]